MKLHPIHAERFLELYKNLLKFVFIQYTDEEIETLEDYLKAREFLFEDTTIIDEFIDLITELEEQQKEILANIKVGIKDTFVYLKTLKKHSILLSDSTNQFYCVLGVTDSIEEIIPEKFSIVETVIINFEDVIICDGLFSNTNFIVGQNIRKDIKSQYVLAKNNKELITHIEFVST